MPGTNKRWDFRGHSEVDGRLYESAIHMTTWAPTRTKAASNLCYRYCKDHDILHKIHKTKLVGVFEMKGQYVTDGGSHE